MAAMASSTSAASYTITDLTPGLRNFYSQGIDINDKGQVLWQRKQDVHWLADVSYVWSASRGSSLVESYPDQLMMSMNNRTAVIYFTASFSGTHAAIYEPDSGPSSQYRLLPYLTDVEWSVPHSINDSGVIVGSSDDWAVMWTADDAVVPLEHNGWIHGIGMAINNAGQIVVVSDLVQGDNGAGISYIWDRNGGYRMLSPLPGETTSWGYSINETGQVVGSSGKHAVLWDTDGTVVDLGVSTDDSYGMAWDINNSGQIVGVVNERAVYWGTDHVMTYLDTLPGAPNTSEARAINDLGLIAGTAQFDSDFTHAVLWQPVPEPNALLVLTLGVSLSALRRRKA